MELDRGKSIIIEDDEYQNDKIHYRDILEKYLYHWKWIVLGAIVGFALAYFMLQVTSYEYEAQSTILIENNEAGNSSELAAFSDLGFGNNQSSIEDEIGILKSLSLMENVVKSLKINIKYYDLQKKANSEIYGSRTPFKINFFTPDSVLYALDTSFVIFQRSESDFAISNEESTMSSKQKFGKNIETHFGQINITPIGPNNSYMNRPILIRINAVHGIASSYRKRLEINLPENNNSNLLRLNLKDQVLQKAKDVLDRVITEYNIKGVNYRNLITRNTDEFINNRISDISEELTSVDKGVEEYKTKNRLTDITYEAEIAIESNTSINKRIVDLNSQIKLINYVVAYLKDNTTELIPTNLGLNDDLTNQNASMYNQLLLEKKRLLKSSSEINPSVITLDEQLNSLRIGIERNLLNLKSTLEISLTDAKSEESVIDYQRYRAPKQEREIQDILRKRQIIESLYLYLLQKREENAIKQGATIPNAQVIDRAIGSAAAVYPSKKKTYALFTLIGGFMPIFLIFIVSIFDNKIHTVEDVEKILSAPILGDVPLVKKKRLKKLIKNQERDAYAESFRILRTNLHFMFSNDKKDEGKTILFTSTIAGEGKTITTLNLAVNLASMDKRVLLIGADLRKPKISQYVKIEKGPGLTHFLVDFSLSVEEIIYKNSLDRFDVINPAEIPPNPSDLLANGRFKKVLEYAKMNYDYILIDTAPLGLVADTMLLQEYADLVIYIIRMNKLDKRSLKLPKQLYENKKIKNMAIVVNGTNYKKSSYGYGYGYS